MSELKWTRRVYRLYKKLTSSSRKDESTSSQVLQLSVRDFSEDAPNVVSCSLECVNIRGFQQDINKLVWECVVFDQYIEHYSMIWNNTFELEKLVFESRSNDIQSLRNVCNIQMCSYSFIDFIIPSSLVPSSLMLSSRDSSTYFIEKSLVRNSRFFFHWQTIIIINNY